MNNFLWKLQSTGSTERTAGSGWLFNVGFSFTKQCGDSVEVKFCIFFVEYSFLFPTVYKIIQKKSTKKRKSCSRQ